MEQAFRDFVTYWSTAHARIRGLGLGTVNMHVVSPWNRPFVTLLLIWLVAGYIPCAPLSSDLIATGHTKYHLVLCGFHRVSGISLVACFPKKRASL